MTEDARMKKIVAAFAAYVTTILVANYVTSAYGMVPIIPGLLYATAGTYLIGVLFVLRDYIQDVAGKWGVFAAIVVGALLSYLVSNPAIVTASVTAFAVSELVDFGVYTPLRKRGYLRAAIASNAVSSVLDTVVFLSIAGFPVWQALPGQVVGKVLITGVVALAVAGVRFQRRLA